MTRSIPEKTLEHWVGMYISNRFPNASFWWPTRNEDMYVGAIRSAAACGPGKIVLLELKTTEVTLTGKHALHIDRIQLAKYLSSGWPPLPVYYVFPAPFWSGPLTSAMGSVPWKPGSSSAPPTAWWRRASGDEWFAKWVFVVSAAELERVLTALHGPVATSKSDVVLHKLAPRAWDAPWPPRVWPVPFSPIPFRDFWAAVVRCGPTSGARWRVRYDKARGLRLFPALPGQDEYNGDSVSLDGNLPQLDVVDQTALAVDDIGSRVLVHLPESVLER